jgi:hypothetical protein
MLAIMNVTRPKRSGGGRLGFAVVPVSLWTGDDKGMTPMRRTITIAALLLGLVPAIASAQDMQSARERFANERELARIYGPEVAAYCEYRWRQSRSAAIYFACFESYGPRRAQKPTQPKPMTYGEAFKLLVERYGGEATLFCVKAARKRGGDDWLSWAINSCLEPGRKGSPS